MIVNNDIPYIAGLILRLDYSDFEMIPKGDIEFAKALILVNSGAASNGIHVSEVSQYQDVLEDYVENFKALYPHYFGDVHPAFVWMAGAIFEEEMSYNYN